MKPVSNIFLKKMRKKWFFYKKSQFFWFDCRQYAKITIVFTKVVDNGLTRFRENAKKPHFFTYFLIWLPSICEKRHTVFTKVVDNDPKNISAKFEASILKRSRENLQKPQKTSFLGIKGPKNFFSDFSAKIGLMHFFPIIMI